VKQDSTLANNRKNIVLTILVAIIMFSAGAAIAQPNTAVKQWPEVVPSYDGTPISWQSFGHGETALILIHGWSCDSRYWMEQVPVLSTNYQVITLDLAGHGHSGQDRQVYSMRSFGEDVRAVVEASGCNKVILVGHSMGGSVIAEAARLMPDKVIGLIGVDCLEDIEYPLTKENYAAMVTPFQQDFRGALHNFVTPMLRATTEQPLREWILNDMSAAPTRVAMSAMHEMMAQYISKDLAKNFDHITCPVVTVNADMEPVNEEANRRHMRFYQAIVLPHTDHFLMLNQPQIFNRALQQAITLVLEHQAP
jgi:pimeloyl-ACP methyl ester carboxylesterase